LDLYLVLLRHRHGHAPLFSSNSKLEALEYLYGLNVGDDCFPASLDLLALDEFRFSGESADALEILLVTFTGGKPVEVESRRDLVEKRRQARRFDQAYDRFRQEATRPDVGLEAALARFLDSPE
jgi:hypothetical protein